MKGPINPGSRLFIMSSLSDENVAEIDAMAEELCK